MTNSPSVSRNGAHGASQHEPHVVIIGGGFAGLAAARELRKAAVRVTLLDRSNHHTFQPLLYQVATAGLAPSDISVPIRWRLRHQANATVLLAEVVGIDATRQIVRLDDGTEIPYDFLIVATGARHAYFGHDEWSAFAPGLKSIEDATDMRQRLLLAFERAERTDDPAVRDANLTFAIVGGGPTGVELAGSIPDITKRALRQEFRRIDTRQTRVLLIEAGPRILSTFPEALSRAAQQDLEGLGVEVRLGVPVTHIDNDSVTIGEERIPTRTVFWAAGNVASPLGRMLDADTDRAGRVKVATDCSVPAHPNVFVVGDLSIVMRENGQPAPAVAPTANQTGQHAARMIVASMNGRPRTPFQYWHKGDLATIGRHKAVAAFGRLHLSGYFTWFLWLFVHLMYLVGFRNRASVLLQWGWAYVTWQRGVRLITRNTVSGNMVTGNSTGSRSASASAQVAAPEAVSPAAVSSNAPAERDLRLV
ncbi:MAG TPA: NAD(P)/FAD-dependent oxidoreductase [Gemmatimonas aurantiaca]|uniref:NADH:ubiquinone reductase (non-electrogenic) n=2 Tax=Gemmatimonas aurantiaca TaxID=173480 RepID=C1A5C7_GEMAT|nr:NAD(P)/FAD-dependent oxidoreductase [Gemmatimonas aurantiaca]BAH37437.1 NADH dehydrogenase [Gemmatimonas aurantiaca T-27]HCT55853.1 NAD(P)/FAD-dependent oxidoreductase [Gemmatimonas aurantiaca]